MDVAVERNRIGSHFVAFLVATLVALASVYCLVVLRMQLAWIGLALFVVTMISLCFSAARNPPTVVVIDESGVYDSRLGVGRIPWSDIEDVQVEVAYGNRFLCFRVRSPERYLHHLSGAQRERLAFHQQLGFRRFNVDARAFNCDLVDLKHRIDAHISQHRA